MRHAGCHADDADDDEGLARAIRESLAHQREEQAQRLERAEGRRRREHGVGDEDVGESGPAFESGSAVEAAGQYGQRDVVDKGVVAQAVGDESTIREAGERAQHGASDAVIEDEAEAAAEADKAAAASTKEGQSAGTRASASVSGRKGKDGESNAAVEEKAVKDDNDNDDDENEEEFGQAVKESLRAHETSERERSEEEVVMEYVKRQSLLEEEHRRRVVEGREKGEKQ